MQSSPCQCEGLYSQLLLQECLPPTDGRSPSGKFAVKVSSSLTGEALSNQPPKSKFLTPKSSHLSKWDEIGRVHPPQELCHPVPFSLRQHCNLTFLQFVTSRVWNYLVQWTVIRPTSTFQLSMVKIGNQNSEGWYFAHYQHSILG